ncbi:MAG: MoxR family ATPase [Cyanobacteria bacterium P01_F01_bin.86]
MTPEEKALYTYVESDDYQPPAKSVNDPEGREYFPYLPEPALVKALNLAIALGRPLLLEGEPGCGKTRVANALAYQLACKKFGGKPEDTKKWWNFYIWNVTSTSRAQDGLYTFDAVGRLRDAQLMGTAPDRLRDFLGNQEVADLKKRIQDKARYLTYGALGKALQDQTTRPVVLIDEIDKADSDFPNDLLLELDELRFTVAELDNKPIGPPDNATKPIILITSNREKPLPEPFLRRCLYYYVPFPQRSRLKEIIQKRFGERIADKDTVVELALDKFDAIYDRLDRQAGSRPPGTSELLEFLTALIEDKDTETAIAELKDLLNEKGAHLLGALVKTKADQEAYTGRELGGKRS